MPWLEVVEQFRVADRAALQARLEAVVAALSLPIRVDGAHPPSSGTGAALVWLLTLLATTLGPPFVLLAAGGTVAFAGSPTDALAAFGVDDLVVLPHLLLEDGVLLEFLFHQRLEFAIGDESASEEIEPDGLAVGRESFNWVHAVSEDCGGEGVVGCNSCDLKAV